MSDLREALIAAMERVRDDKRPGVRYFLIPDFADACIAVIKDWTAEMPDER